MSPVSLCVCACLCNNSNNISLHAMAFGSKMDKPSSSQEGGVVGLNFHQSKEVLINDSNGSIYTVRAREREKHKPKLCAQQSRIFCRAHSLTRSRTVRHRRSDRTIPMTRKAARIVLPISARSRRRARYALCSPRTCCACGETWA